MRDVKKHGIIFFLLFSLRSRHGNWSLLLSLQHFLAVLLLLILGCSLGVLLLALSELTLSGNEVAVLGSIGGKVGI
jgi:hypothetical protein